MIANFINAVRLQASSNLIRYILNLIKETFEIDNATASTIIITLTVVVVGYLVNALYHAVKSFISRRDTRVSFRLLVHKLSESSIKQSIGFSKTVELMDIRNQYTITFIRVDFYSIRFIHEIGFTRVYNSFFYGFENMPCVFSRGKRVKLLHKIFETSSNIEFWMNRALESYNSFQTLINQDNDKRNAEINELRRKAEELIVTSNINTINKSNQELVRLFEYVKRLDGVLASWQRQFDRTNPYIVNHQVIIPLLDLSREFYDLKSSRELVNHLLFAKFHYDQMIKLIEQIKDQYTYFSRIFKSYNKILNIASKI